MKVLLAILVASLFFGCSDQSKKDTKQVEPMEKKVEVKKEVVEPKKVEPKQEERKVEPKKVEVQKVVKKVEKVVTKTKEKVKEISKTISSVTDNKEVKKVTEKITKTLDSLSLPKTTDTATKSAEEKSSSNPTSDLKSMATGLVAGLGGGAVAATQPKKSSVDGVALFKSKCSSCHGAKAEKKALGKSEIIAKWDSKKIADALKGYKAGTFGGSMKAIMQGQAKGLSDEQITALANDIPKL